MILVVGGIASGKRTYAESLGFPPDDMAFDVHELVRGGEDAAALADRLGALSVVTCCEVGSGVVPLDPGERQWREAAGRLMALLAARADKVVRMVCGIPTTLKDTVEFILIRHGQTPGNGKRCYVGALDQPLSEEGRAQARAAQVPDGVRRVYVSKLRRTHETAALMFPDAEQVVVDGIQEMDFGDFAGRSADDMADDPAYRAWVDSFCTTRCPGGESRDEFTDRVCAALESLLRAAAARGEKRVVMVAHGGTMMASLSRFSGIPDRYYEWLVGNCESYRIRVELTPSSIAFAPLEHGRECSFPTQAG